MPVFDKHYLVQDFIVNNARKYPEKTAVVYENQRLCFREILEMAKAVASSLNGNGTQKGDRVILMHENSASYVISYYGILMIGGVVVSINPDMKKEALFSLLEETTPTAAILSQKAFALFQDLPSSCDCITYIIVNGTSISPLHEQPYTLSLFNDVACDDRMDFSPPDIIETDLAAIIYTSGSTGKPKGVMLSHKNIVTNTRSICTYLNLTEKDTQMVVLPFFYVMGKSLLNTHMAAGGTVVINNKFTFPAAVVNQMIKENVTGFSGVPSTFAYLLHRSPLAKSREKLGALRYVSQAGGHMPKQIKKTLREVLPEHTQIIIMYGATEASARLTWLDPEHFTEKIDSIGKAIPEVSINIIDKDGSILPHDQIGEITAQGANIMQGYWKNEAATKQVLDHNGYHTGDMGYTDTDGYIFVTGRKDNQLKVSGHRVDPQEIEDVIMESQQLIELAVIGVSDSLMGNKLYGVAVPVKGTVTAQDILAFASSRLSRHKVPSDIFFIRTIPKNPSGKIDRSQCKKIVNEKINC